MITTILTTHLVLVAIYIVSLLVLAASALARKNAQLVKQAAYGSFGAIIGTGVLLAALSPRTIAHLCVSALVATSFGYAVSKLYERRVIAIHTS